MGKKGKSKTYDIQIPYNESDDYVHLKCTHKLKRNEMMKSYGWLPLWLKTVF